MGSVDFESVGSRETLKTDTSEMPVSRPYSLPHLLFPISSDSLMSVLFIPRTTFTFKSKVYVDPTDRYSQPSHHQAHQKLCQALRGQGNMEKTRPRSGLGVLMDNSNYDSIWTLFGRKDLILREERLPTHLHQPIPTAVSQNMVKEVQREIQKYVTKEINR